jgi:hypothetical protein
MCVSRRSAWASLGPDSSKSKKNKGCSGDHYLRELQLFVTARVSISIHLNKLKNPINAFTCATRENASRPLWCGIRAVSLQDWSLV